MKSCFRRLRRRWVVLRRSVVLGAVALAVAVGGAKAALDAVDEGVVNACRHKSGYLLVPSTGYK